MLMSCRISLLAAALFVVPAAAQEQAPPEEVSYPGVGKEEHFLASGPLPVVLTRFVTAQGKAAKVEANLVLLKQEGIFYREKEGSGALKPMVREAPNRFDPILSIQARVGEETITWTLDKKNKRFTGPVLPPPEIKIRPAAFSKEDESKYLFFVYLAMQDQLDTALQKNDQAGAQRILDWAELLEEHARASGLSESTGDFKKKFKGPKKAKKPSPPAASGRAPKDVGDLLGALFAYHEDLKQLGEQRAALLKKAAETDARLADEWEAIQRRHAGAANKAIFRGVVGFVAEDRNLIAEGAVGLARAATSLNEHRRQLQLLKSHSDKAILEEAETIKKREELARLKRDETVKTIERTLRLPERDSIAEFAKEMEKSKDLTSAVRRLNVLAERYRQATPHGNPWLQQEIYFLEALVPHAATQNQQKVDKLAELAEKTFAEVKNIPPARAYDQDRTVMLWQAAQLAIQAAVLEIGNERSLKDAYSEHAVFGLRLLHLSKKHDFIDIGANIRELEVFALGLCGMHQEALELGSTIAEARADSPYLHYFLAKVYAASADSRESLPAARAALVRAIKAGFGDIPGVKKNADLKKIIDAKFTYEHLTPVLRIRVIPPKAGFGKCGLQVTNVSPFPVKKVHIVWLMPVFNMLRPADEFRIDTLAPGQSRTWDQTRVTHNSFNSSATFGTFVAPGKDLRLDRVN